MLPKYGTTSRNNRTIPNGALIGGVANFYTNTRPTSRVDGSALVVGDLWFNPSTGVLGFWNGTYWLSSTLFKTKIMSTTSAVGTGSNFFAGFEDSGKNIFIERHYLSTVFTPVAISDAWNLSVSIRGASFASNVYSFPTISTIASNTTDIAYYTINTLNTAIDLSLARAFFATLTRTGNSASAWFTFGFFYRDIL